MLFQSLKKIIIFSVIAVFCYGLFLSCENPFSSDLGGKVNVEPPTISVASPVSGAYIKGVARFGGMATAYRELKKVEAKIFDSEGNTLQDWTAVGMEMAGGVKEKNWAFTIDTLNFFGSEVALNDGFLKMQFRASDGSLTAYTKEQVYIVKNGPSIVKLTAPDSAKLETETVAPKIGTNTEISGQIIDRRGLKPGYPRIKIWPEDKPEPAGDVCGDSENGWGWAALFLSGVDEVNTQEEIDQNIVKQWRYADRTQQQVVRVSNFVFRLAEFEVDENTREVRYILDGGGYKPLPTKIYNFRIISSDTFFNSDANARNSSGNSIYLFPRDPQAGSDEIEAVGFYPKDLTGTLDSGEFYAMQLIDSGIRPEIILDNSDKTTEELEAVPNIYMTESTAKKTIKENQTAFRLRIVAAHKSEPIEKAILQWEHITAADPDAGGFLAWDNNVPGTEGYFDPDNPAEGGHKGIPKSGNFLEGKNFVFTADGSHKYTASGGVEEPVFVSSTVPYSLIVTVYSLGGLSTTQKYTVYLDGSAPHVSIRSVMGAYSEPVGDALADVDSETPSVLLSGGTINVNPYTVNGNIQVAVDRSASMGIASTVWIVEEDKPNYLTATDTILSKLRDYFATPSSAGLTSIYENIFEGHMCGIKDPTPNPLSNPYQLRFNTLKQNNDGGNDWDNPLNSADPPQPQYPNRYLWLYVIAQDTVQNLGFTVQKLRVDDSTDIPVLKVPDLDDTITSAEGLLYGNGNTERKNILGIYNGIDLAVTDDDGVSRTKGNIEIWLTDLNGETELRKQVPSTEIEKVMTVGAEIYEAGSSKEWIGSLSQQIMAATLYAGQTPLPQYLADGMYKIEISVKDNFDVKVAIDGERPGDTPEAKMAIPDPQTYFFAVQSRDPVVLIDTPVAGSTQNETPVPVRGRVLSPFELTSLNISFEPDVISDEKSNNKRTDPMLWEYVRREDGNYVYSWEYEKLVNFAPNFAFASSDRRVEVDAVDGLGVPGSADVRVVVDNDPPTVRLGEFNFDRPPQAVVEGGTQVMRYVVNGKVPLKINVYDQAGIKTNEQRNNEGVLTAPATHFNICWWVISQAYGTWVAPTWNPANDPALPAGTSGAFGRFAINSADGNDYSLLLNTVALTNGTYRLYVIAQDVSGNIGANNVVGSADWLQEFTVDQDSDNPVLDTNLAPVGGYINTITSGGLKITGTVTDDDGFDRNKLGTYVRIRFPTTVDTSTTPPTITWGNWLTITTVTLGAGGEIDFTYTPPSGTAYPNTHLTGDGTKYYQIEVRDEAAPGTGNNPPGKNPPGTAVPSNPTLPAVLRIYPISTNNTVGYSFTIKNVPPQIFFSRYDPTSGTGHNYSAERPAYRTASAMLADLRGGWVVDSYLNASALTITYTSNGATGIPSQILPSTLTDGRHNWNITTIESSLTTHFNALNSRNGMHTITIVAEDMVGGSTRVEWSFAKDTEGPVISGPSDRIIKDEASVSGTFYDDISPLFTLGAGNLPIETFNYRFYSSGADEDEWLKDGVIVADANDTSRRRASWTLSIPPLDDGECVVEILAGDVLGNFGLVSEYVALTSTYTSAATGNTNNSYAPGTRYFVSSGNDNPRDKGLNTGSIVSMNGVLRYVLWVGSTGTGDAARYQIKVSEGISGTSATTVYPASGAAINNQPVSVIPGTKFTFTLDRNAPLVSPVNLMTVYANQIIDPARTMDENERVFSAADVSPITDTTFILSGLAYDRNLTELIANINGGTTITKQIRGPAFEDWVKTGTGFYPPEANAAFRVRKATSDDRDTHEPKPGDTPSDVYTYSDGDLAHLYVWELHVTKGDVATLLGGSAIPGERRSITIVARDVAQRNSIRDNWLFYLDNQSPTVTFLNANWSTGAYVRTTFERLNLQGIIEDDTFVKSLKYTIARWDYSTSAWGYRVNGAWSTSPDPSTDYDADWVELLASTGKNVTWTLSDEALGEGQYRINLRFTDYSLSAGSNSGNLGTKVLDFYVDRTPPEIKWVTAKKEFYRSDDLKFSLSATDTNSIQVPTAQVRLVGATTGTPVTVTSVSLTGTTRTFTVGSITGLTEGNRYTLILTVTDQAGNVAVTDNTLDFLVDNTAPTLAVTPDPGIAIVGRVEFQGKFNDTLSPITRVAFMATSGTGSAPAIPNANTIQTAISLGSLSGTALDKYLTDNGWVFNTNAQGSFPYLTTDGTQDGERLMDIDGGLATAKMLMWDTKEFGSSASRYLSVVNVSRTFEFDGSKNVTGDVHTLPLYFLAIDEAGNVQVLSQTYYIYPDGDLPRITAINNPNDTAPEAERLMNGTIRISGTAVDNVRIKNVWFRIIDKEPTLNNGDPNTNYDKPITTLQIPVWNQETWDPMPPANEGDPAPTQTAKDQTLYPSPTNPNPAPTPGWFMANGGGSKSVAWWAYINNNNELDPTGEATERKIEIQVIAEDTRWKDSENAGAGGYDPGDGLFPKAEKSVAAKVVRGAPRFGDEWIKMGASNANYGSTTDGWNGLSAINLTKRSAYALVVQHEMGVGAIRWNQGGTTINLLDESNPYNQSYQATLTRVNAGNEGIAVKAVPRTTITTNITIAAGTEVNNRTYLIWNPGTTVPTVSLQGGGTLSATDNVRYTKFTAAAGTTITVNGATLMPMTAGGVFEWVIVADLYTTALTDMAGKAEWYPLNLSASEISKAVPLTTNHAALLPVDNIYPEGVYTHATNVVGTANSFGGEAGDGGTVKGVDRVVLWFSREVNGTERSIAWDEIRVPASVPTFETGTAPVGISFPPGFTKPATVDYPRIYNAGDKAGETLSNRSSIVIDRNDPLGRENHHGHASLRMGFAPGGGLGTTWYVTLNSTHITSGRVTAHYVVYDRAGNATYYNRKLMILNGRPIIANVKLATDLRGGAGLDLAGALRGTAATGVNLANGSASSNVPTTNFIGGARGGDSALKRIKDRFIQRVTDISATSSDASVGIGDAITINTNRLNNYDVVYDDSFTVRNNLLAAQVNTLTAQTSGKTRSFRFEYVQNVRRIAGANIISTTAGANLGIRAGRMYIIENTGEAIFPWGALGVQGEVPRRGLAFVAMEDGNVAIPTWNATNYGTPSVWELNGSYYNSSTSLTRTYPTAQANMALSDVSYPTNGGGTFAEFVYQSNAFGNNLIVDYNPTPNNDAALSDFNADGRPKTYPFPSVVNGNQSPHLAHSLFIVRVFDGAESELFGDFALLSIRVNNNDKTKPYAQMYDLNPKTEGVDNPQTVAETLSPGTTVGNNRAKGGLYNENERNTSLIAKSGHIEPRTGTSLTSSEMGGAVSSTSGSMQKPFADSTAYFTVDTVSGNVVVRGYAEDDTKVGSIALEFWNEANNGTRLQEIPILTNAAAITTPPTGENKLPAVGFMTAAAGIPAARISVTEALDLNRHRVEWAYVWDAEGVTNTPVGNINVRVVAYNTNTDTNPVSANKNSDRITRSTLTNANRTAYDYYNPTYPNANSPASTGNFYRYNDIRVNLRPYITGFVRNKTELAHDTRSRQGRYMFAQSEVVVIKGFNLGAGTAAPTIGLPSGNVTPTAANSLVSAANQTNFGLASTSASRYRIFTVPAAAATGHGMVTYTVSTRVAVNTGDSRGIDTNNNSTNPVIRRPAVIQPWNVEYSSGVPGSELWDDFTTVHIWQSNDDQPGAATTNNSYFRSSTSGTTTNNWPIMNPAMSIEPGTGILHASHNENGSVGNGGTLRASTNNGNTAVTTPLIEFIDPIISSDIYYSPGNGTIGAARWAVSSLIGRAGANQYWGNLGGVYISGPQGVVVTAGTNNNNITIADGGYYVESTWYNASTTNTATNADGVRGGVSTPPSTDQFLNPHIITSYSDGFEHIHVSYYDSNGDGNGYGSIKYRYNRRSAAGTINGNGAPRVWTNLDGGYDAEDRTVLTGGDAFPAVEANYRIVNYSNRPTSTLNPTTRIDAGEHNAIAVTSQGYPVIAYYDATTQKLKLAVSRAVNPVDSRNWVIVDVLPDTGEGSAYKFGTGQYVSIAIDNGRGAPATGGTGDVLANRIHIAARNIKGDLVYIRGQIAIPTLGTGATYTATGGGFTLGSVQIVDSVGTVGRWCKISLDEYGNPWIAYQDDGYLGGRDGAKMAYLNTDRFTKGAEDTTFEGEDIDLNGTPISGWEAMHIPTQFRVENPSISGRENGRLGMECFPTRNVTTTNTRTWGAAVSYFTTFPTTKYRIVYYVK